MIEENCIVKFETTNCAVCKMMEPTWNKFKEQNKNIVFLKINLDEHPEFTEKFDITTVPVFMSIKNGAEDKRLIGINDIKKLSTIL